MKTNDFKNDTAIYLALGAVIGSVICFFHNGIGLDAILRILPFTISFALLIGLILNRIHRIEKKSEKNTMNHKL